MGKVEVDHFASRDKLDFGVDIIFLAVVFELHPLGVFVDLDDGASIQDADEGQKTRADLFQSVQQSTSQMRIIRSFAQYETILFPSLLKASADTGPLCPSSTLNFWCCFNAYTTMRPSTVPTARY